MRTAPPQHFPVSIQPFSTVLRVLAPKYYCNLISVNTSTTPHSLPSTEHPYNSSTLALNSIYTQRFRQRFSHPLLHWINSTNPLTRVKIGNIAKYLALTIQNFASKWRWGIVRNDSFLFHKARRLWFPITLTIHFITIGSLFIYLGLVLEAFCWKSNENYLQLSHTQEQTTSTFRTQSALLRKKWDPVLLLILLQFYKTYFYWFLESIKMANNEKNCTTIASIYWLYYLILLYTETNDK